MKKVLGLKSNTAVEIISALFIILFFYTALSKTYNIDATIDALSRTKVFTEFERYIAWSVVIVEYLAAILLFLPKTRNIGLRISFVLMAAFSTYVALMMIFLTSLPCSCGGVISQMNWTQHLIFNIAFTILAYIAIRINKSISENSEQVETKQAVFT